MFYIYTDGQSIANSRNLEIHNSTPHKGDRQNNITFMLGLVVKDNNKNYCDIAISTCPKFCCKPATRVVSFYEEVFAKIQMHGNHGGWDLKRWILN